MCVDYESVTCIYIFMYTIGEKFVIIKILTNVDVFF